MSGVKRSYSTQEVLEQISVDHDSDEEEENELINDILEDDSRCDDEEENDNDEPSDEPLYFLNKVRTRGGPNPLLNRRRGARTRGGGQGSSSRGESKEQKQNRLEEKWILGSWGYKKGYWLDSDGGKSRRIYTSMGARVTSSPDFAVPVGMLHGRIYTSVGADAQRSWTYIYVLGTQKARQSVKCDLIIQRVLFLLLLLCSALLSW